jgi:hypothetical protein
MDVPTRRWQFPARAAASVIFACFAVMLFSACLNVDTVLGSRFQQWVTDPVRTQLLSLSHLLHIVFRGLSIAAILWCVLSWCSTESRIAAGIATALVVLVVLENLLMFNY